ncbi:hypothetical protein COBT_004010 [Conglomerata obtusa]
MYWFIIFVECMNTSNKNRYTYDEVCITVSPKDSDENKNQALANLNEVKSTGAVKRPEKTIEQEQAEIAILGLEKQMINILESINEKSDFLCMGLGDARRIGKLLNEKHQKRKIELLELEKVQDVLNQLVKSNEK